jgi:hypothetical protein
MRIIKKYFRKMYGQIVVDQTIFIDKQKQEEKIEYIEV